MLNDSGLRFQTAMAQLANSGISPCITTDPLLPLLNRGRYRGHLRWKGGNSAELGKAENWEDFIRHPFPAEFKRPNSPLSTCALTGVELTTGVTLSRVFIVKNRAEFKTQPACQEVETLVGNSQRFDANGPVRVGGLPLMNPFYNQLMVSLCPTAEVDNFYRNKWLAQVFEQGAKLVEFMKVLWGPGLWSYCYNKNHQHILPAFPDTQNVPYDNVIGFGPWAVRRMQALFNAAYDIGLSKNPAFALTVENTPVEPLIPYVNEFYHSSALYQHIYAEAVSAKMELGAYPPYVMPGYQEQRKLIDNAPPPDDPASITRPSYMIDDPLRDTGGPPDVTTWRKECQDYFNDYFQIARYGLAPRFYPTADSPTAGSKAPAPTPWDARTPADPLAETNWQTYTYCRCIQDVFNLRARIFDVGGRAVNGERVLAHAYLFVKPFGHEQPYNYYDYNEELIKTMTRAIHMHAQQAAYFRGGRMLGKTIVKLLPPDAQSPAPPATVWALRAPFRPFNDVTPLTRQLSSGGNITQDVLDFLSLGFDKAYPKPVSSDRLPHMVWQKRWDDNKYRYLYVFANVGNTPLKFQFQFTRWLDTLVRWRKIVRVFDDRDYTGCDPSGRPAGSQDVRPGDWEMAFANQTPLAERSFATVELFAL